MCNELPSTHEPLEYSKDGSVPELSQSHLVLNNRYRILKPLGQGGFGKTFLAVDEKSREQTQDITSSGHSTPELCVIKQFFPQHHTLHHYQKASELFHQESLRLALLGKHPQIPQLLDTFAQDGQQYLVQEWIDGQTLEQELAEAGAFSETEIWQLLQQLLPVLQFIHEHQVIHRDIKPANIIRRQSDRQLVLVDFGAAQYTTARILDKTGTLIGSAEYAAPEQVRGKAVFASDLYSLGVTCLHLLTQIPPFDLYDCCEDIWIWRSYLTTPISKSLEQILHKLLQKATKRRYQSATEVLVSLKTFSKYTVVSSQPTASRSTDDFETPYFGLSRQANLSASITAYAAALDIHSIAAITVFDPQTQSWHYLPSKMEAKEIARKVTAFLGPRLAATATSPVQDQVSKMPDSNKRLWRVLGAIAATSLACFTVASVILKIESHSTVTTWKVENLRIFQEIFSVGSK